MINGAVIGTWALTSLAPFTPETVTFTVGTSGSQMLALKGLATGDHTAFLSDVSIFTAASLPEPATLPLIIMGLLAAFGLAARKRRRSDNSAV